MQGIALAYVAAFFGLVGYSQAATFERDTGRRPYGLPPSVWGGACFAFGPLAALVLVVGQRNALRVPRRTPDLRRVPARPQSSPHQPQRPPTPQPQRTAPRHGVPRLQQQWVPRPQQHPSDAHKLYLFGVPQSQQPWIQASSGWSSAQQVVPANGGSGGTDLLPRAPLTAARSRRHTVLGRR